MSVLWATPRDVTDWTCDPTTGADDNLRIMLCPCCGSEGVLIYAYRNDPDNERYEECPECEGACVVLVEVEPIDIEDLEAAEADLFGHECGGHCGV